MMVDSAKIWESAIGTDFASLKGDVIYSRDSTALGEIDEIIHPDHQPEEPLGGHFFRFQTGPLKDLFGGLDDAYIPEAMIVSVSDGAIMIDMTYQEIPNRRWELPIQHGYHRS
jgi:hypothetical protein